MSELAIIADAIRELRPEPNFFKDYGFPILLGFFSALTGGLVALVLLRIQQIFEREKERVQICSEWILLAEWLLQGLLAVKANYAGRLDSDPFQRALTVPTILGGLSRVEKNASELVFMLPNQKRAIESDSKWRQVPNINGMLTNYNLLVDLVEKRNSVERPWREKILESGGDIAAGAFLVDDIIKLTGQRAAMEVIDLTENVISQTDDLIIDLSDFTKKFPGLARDVINTKIAKRFGSIPSISSENNPVRENLLARTSKVNVKKLSQILGRTEEDLDARYNRNR